MSDHFTLPPVADQRTPLGRALLECEEFCVAPCCGMEAYNISVDSMQRWAKTASASDLEQALREVEAALESLALAPERFYFLDCEHARSEVGEWFETIRRVLRELRA